MNPIASFLFNGLEFFLRGGFFMGCLLVLSIIALTVIILRGTALLYHKILPAPILDEIENFNGEKGDRLISTCVRYPSPLGRIILVLLRHRNWPRAENVEAVQTRARRETSLMEMGLVILEIATGIAPLIGLLGTLSGLVSVFANVGETGRPEVVARGISEALNNTIVGLALAACALIAHSYFYRRIEVMAVEMESIVSDLMIKCYPRQQTEMNMPKKSDD
ncbi:MAG: MotA/TolQ/ExbB proton channel family protein [Verrucomicrobia bacterium]|nr:MAG: MotA/TolQ/ExbB proton channel family protein [Verrucomicrobiota bacterium]